MREMIVKKNNNNQWSCALCLVVSMHLGDKVLTLTPSKTKIENDILNNIQQLYNNNK